MTLFDGNFNVISLKLHSHASQDFFVPFQFYNIVQNV